MLNGDEGAREFARLLTKTKEGPDFDQYVADAKFLMQNHYLLASYMAGKEQPIAVGAVIVPGRELIDRIRNIKVYVGDTMAALCLTAYDSSLTAEQKSLARTCLHDEACVLAARHNCTMVLETFDGLSGTFSLREVVFPHPQ